MNTFRGWTLTCPESLPKGAIKVRRDATSRRCTRTGNNVGDREYGVHYTDPHMETRRLLLREALGGLSLQHCHVGTVGQANQGGSQIFFLSIDTTIRSVPDASHVAMIWLAMLSLMQYEIGTLGLTSGCDTLNKSYAGQSTPCNRVVQLSKYERGGEDTP
ncbi:hypothetical protein J1614_001836 [Plenodomus biglobosus]|nr:hypothetical protein J1614_001836 [Plenodomus biglobosus]